MILGGGKWFDELWEMKKEGGMEEVRRMGSRRRSVRNGVEIFFLQFYCGSVSVLKGRIFVFSSFLIFFLLQCLFSHHAPYPVKALATSSLIFSSPVPFQTLLTQSNSIFQ